MKNFLPILVIVIVVGAIFLGISYFQANKLSQNVQSATGGCVMAGCSSQLCLDENAEPIATTCEWRDFYECYKKYSHCERQPDSQCGWTETEEFLACMAEKGPGYQPWEDNKIVLHGPTENQVISSPASFNGAAAGGWFKDGFFNIIVVDENYVELGRTSVGLPEDFNQNLNAGNFSGQVEFNESETSCGYIILAKPDAAINDPINSYKRKVQLICPSINDDYLELDNCDRC